MDFLTGIYSEFREAMDYDIGTTTEILTLLTIVLLISLYIFVVYRVVSHKSMYNKSFHISVTVIPFFIAIIVKALQSNFLITLGAIGALAIIRFRTAIKDPVDMIYILWSIFIGITCGCSLYKSCILTSAVVTVVLVLINLLGDGLLKNPSMLIINASGDVEDVEKNINSVVNGLCKKHRLKSKSFTDAGIDFVFQIETKKEDELVCEIRKISGIKQLTLLKYDGEDVI